MKKIHEMVLEYQLYPGRENTIQIIASFYGGFKRYCCMVSCDFR
jgi:hypothetical protein